MNIPEGITPAEYITSLRLSDKYPTLRAILADISDETLETPGFADLVNGPVSEQALTDEIVWRKANR